MGKLLSFLTIFLVILISLGIIEFFRFKPGEFYNAIYHKDNTTITVFNNGYWHDMYDLCYIVNGIDYVKDYTVKEGSLSEEGMNNYTKSLTKSGFRLTEIHQCNSSITCNGFVTGKLFQSIVYYIRWSIIVPLLVELRIQLGISLY